MRWGRVLVLAGAFVAAGTYFVAAAWIAWIFYHVVNLGAQ